jgi:hypothetical protein
MKYKFITMLVTDRPIDEFWCLVDLSCLWRTDRPMSFDACSLFDDCEGHTNRWILTTVWSTILSLTFYLILSRCIWRTDRPMNLDAWSIYHACYRWTNRQISTTTDIPVLWRTHPPSNFDARSMNYACDRQTNRWILTPVRSIMPVTDRPTDEFRRLFYLRWLWRTY